jgi:predicted outer membrane repeat protein
MKNIPAGTFIVAVAIFMLAQNGCSNIPLESSSVPEGQDTGSGSITVSFSQGAAQTLIPMLVLDNVYLEYWFSKDGERPVAKIPVDNRFVLEPGYYDLTVKAFVDAAQEELAAQGDTNFTITAGVGREIVNLILDPAAGGEGTGELDFRLEYPAGTIVETLTLTRIAGAEGPINLMYPAPSSSGVDPLTLSGRKTNIPAAYYLFRVLLRNNAGAATEKAKVVHIYRDQTAEAVYAFAAEDFKFYWVSNTADSGLGSLRQALIDVPNGETIQVRLEPGSVITLEHDLTIHKSLNIEGNGVTLAQTSSSRLLNIHSGQVRIRRVHFKNGRNVNYGGAIYNHGTLTLESCIFSGNQTTRDNYGGGAIYSNNSLTIRGCTFYGNIARTSGGAINFDAPYGTLTMTGNLFFGNISMSNYPVVRIYRGNAGSVSFNMVDTALGMENNQCGWMPGTGDTSFTALGISGVPVNTATFAPVGGLRGVLLKAPEHFPATDFYGFTRAFHGAPGAVGY